MLALREDGPYTSRDLIAAYMLEESFIEVLPKDAIKETTGAIAFGSYLAYMGMMKKYSDEGKNNMLKDIWGDISREYILNKFCKTLAERTFLEDKLMHDIFSKTTRFVCYPAYNGSEENWYKALERTKSIILMKIEEYLELARIVSGLNNELKDTDRRYVISRVDVDIDSVYMHLDKVDFLIAKKFNGEYRIYDMVYARTKVRGLIPLPYIAQRKPICGIKDYNLRWIDCNSLDKALEVVDTLENNI